MIYAEADVTVQVDGVTVERLHRWIKRGWLAPAIGEEGYAYTEVDIARVDLIRQFRDELSVDAEAVPVLLSLIDQLYGLRRELRCFMRAIDEQPTDVRGGIIDRIKILQGE